MWFELIFGWLCGWRYFLINWLCNINQFCNLFRCNHKLSFVQARRHTSTPWNPLTHCIMLPYVMYFFTSSIQVCTFVPYILLSGDTVDTQVTKHGYVCLILAMIMVQLVMSIVLFHRADVHGKKGGLICSHICFWNNESVLTVLMIWYCKDFVRKRQEHWGGGRGGGSVFASLQF